LLARFRFQSRALTECGLPFGALRTMFGTHRHPAIRPDNSEATMVRLFTQSEAADLLRLSERTLERLRLKGNGPKYVKAGRAVRYREVSRSKGMNTSIVISGYIRAKSITWYLTNCGKVGISCPEITGYSNLHSWAKS
jgi:hypothetical protein